METLSLVPWVEKKLTTSYSWAKSRADAKRRVLEYKQMIRWTRSSLRVSTVFDWGHTCDIAQAIIRSAVKLFRDLSLAPSHNVNVKDAVSNVSTFHFEICDETFLFFSRTLCCKTIREEISPQLWICIIERLVVQEREEGDSLLEYLVVSYLTWRGNGPWPAQCDGHLHKDIGALLSQWILQSDNARQQWEKFNETIESIRPSEEDLRFAAPGQFPLMDEAWNESVGINVVKEELETGRRVVFLLARFSNAFTVTNKLSRCCPRNDGTVRQRALAKHTCKGINIVTSTQTVRTMRKWTKTWTQLRALWLEFIDNWEIIVKMASHSFSFPLIRDMDNLLLHDMITGYVGSSRILRHGGKYTSKSGTTIVHPGERAAVVSSRCTLLSIENSAVKRHGPLRRWGSAADEFARYALLRCDLVDRLRMNFKDAVRDWTTTYAKWDRTPAYLSEWAKYDEETLDFVADDYRVVLLRQALGRKRSIQIMSAPGTACSIFGGFIRPASNKPCGKALVIDQPLTIKVTVFPKDWYLPFGVEHFIKDKWGSIVDTKADESGYVIKRVSKTGKPGIRTLKPGIKTLKPRASRIHKSPWTPSKSSWVTEQELTFD